MSKVRNHVNFSACHASQKIYAECSIFPVKSRKWYLLHYVYVHRILLCMNKNCHRILVQTLLLKKKKNCTEK